MSFFRIYVDGSLFYHPNLSKLAITQAKVSEDAESIDCLTISAPYNHPYLDSVHPMASVIICKKGETIVFEGRAMDDGSDFIIHTHGNASPALHILRTLFSLLFPIKVRSEGCLNILSVFTIRQWKSRSSLPWELLRSQMTMITFPTAIPNTL